MTDNELKAVLENELELLNNAIAYVIQTGEEYSVDTGSTKRTFKADLDELYNKRDKVAAEIQNIDGDGGVMFSSGW